MVTLKETNMAKEFEGYPQRQIRLSEKEWVKLKRQKLKSGLTWNNFIKQLTLKDK